MAKISQIYTLITADDKPFKRGLESARKEAVKGAKRIQNALGKINFKALALGATALTGTLVYATKKFTDAAAEQEAVEKRLAAVLNSTGEAAGYNIEQLKAMAAQMQRVTTTGDEVILSGQAILATFTRISGEAFQRATMAALDLSEVMQQDLRTSIVQIGKALNDPIANLGALGRAGIQFTKEQKEMIKSLWEGGRAADAQNIILTEMERQFGGTAKAARDTFGGALKSTGNILGDISEKIGFKLIPPIKDLVIRFRDWLDVNDKLVSQKIPEFIERVATVATKTASAIGNLYTRFEKFYELGYSEELALERLEKSRKGYETLIYVLEDLDDTESERYKHAKQALDIVNRKIALTKAEMEENRHLYETNRLVAISYKEVDKLRKLKEVGNLGLDRVAKDSEAASEGVEKLNGLVENWQKISESAAMGRAGGIFRESAGALEILDGQFESYLRKLEENSADIKDYWMLQAEDRASVNQRALEIIASQEEQTSSHLIQLSERTAAAMQENFSDLFFDAITGELKDFSDYANAIFTSIERAWADIMGQMVTESIFGNLTKSTGGGGFLGKIFGGLFNQTATSTPTTIRGGQGGGYGFQGGGFVGERVRGVGLSSGKSYEFHPNEFVLPNDKIGGSNVEVIINNSTGQPVEQNETIGPDNTRRLEIWIGNRITGRGPINQAIQSAFNVSPRGRNI